MPKTIEEMRDDFYRFLETTRSDKVEGFPPSSTQVADYWLGVISQRDRELREKIKEMSIKEGLESSQYNGAEKFRKQILSLLNDN